jgi:oxygen-independent coproporphyrinogen-3 oxidase
MCNSLYIHIPFCRKKCIYCDFYSIGYNSSLAQDYINALVGELNAHAEKKFSTIYIGGGTPSILDLKVLQQLFGALKNNIAQTCEFTVEANPESLTEEKLKFFFDKGVNRLSIGAQSFNPAKLKRLCRIHNEKDAFEKFALASKAGFKNISCDLIFGVWGETLTAWHKDLATALSLPVTHISAYSLSCEDATPLFREVDAGRVGMMSEEEQAQFFSFAMHALPEVGFKQYEVSNFARDGFECQHNMRYWRNESYLGLGASACGYLDGMRYKNIANVKNYIKCVKKGNERFEYTETLTARERAHETAALKIRVAEGIDFDWFKVQTGFELMDICDKSIEYLLTRKLINVTAGGIKLTTGGFLFADDVSSALL